MNATMFPIGANCPPRYKHREEMTVKELKEALSAYPEDMELVLFRQECEDYEEFYDNEFLIETNDDNQLVID